METLEEGKVLAEKTAVAAVIAWALWGIMNGQGGRIELIHILCLIGMCVILMLSLRLLIVKYILVR
jgi:hypothetical protein